MAFLLSLPSTPCCYASHFSHCVSLPLFCSFCSLCAFALVRTILGSSAMHVCLVWMSSLCYPLAAPPPPLAFLPMFLLSAPSPCLPLLPPFILEGWFAGWGGVHPYTRYCPGTVIHRLLFYIRSRAVLCMACPLVCPWWLFLPFSTVRDHIQLFSLVTDIMQLCNKHVI